jgi:hypothetical protein
VRSNAGGFEGFKHSQRRVQNRHRRADGRSERFLPDRARGKCPGGQNKDTSTGGLKKLFLEGLDWLRRSVSAASRAKSSTPG